MFFTHTSSVIIENNDETIHESGDIDKYDYTIRIDSDEDLSRFYGEGTSDSPYMIEEEEINAEGRGSAIYIGNTTSHFLLTNNSLSRASEDPYDYNWNSCLALYNVTNGMVHQNTISSGEIGIYLKNVHNVTIEQNTITQSSSSGIYLEGSNYTHILQNEILHGNGKGVHLTESTHIELRYNTISNNRREGIHVQSSHYNHIVDNEVSGNNVDGLYLQSSLNNTVDDNGFQNTGVRILGNSLEHWSTHNISDKNTLHGSPIYYVKDQEGGTIPSTIAQAILVNVSHVNIHDIELETGSTGLAIAFSSDISVDNVFISSQVHDGIHVLNSPNNNFSNIQLTGNGVGAVFDNSKNNMLNSATVVDNPSGGLDITGSSHLQITESFIDGNGQTGVKLHNSPDSILYNSTFSSNGLGVSVEQSDNVNISDGKFVDNSEGIFLSHSIETTIYNNTFGEAGIRMAGNIKEHWNSHPIEENTVACKPLIYWNDRIGGDIDDDAGQIIITNSTDVNVSDQKLSGGIIIAFSEGIFVQNVTSYNHSRDSLHIYRSHHNTFNSLDLYSNHRGIYNFLSDDNNFTNITAVDNHNGIFMHHSDGSVVSRSYFGESTAGIYSSSSSSMHVENNTFEENADSVVLFRTEYSVLINNWMVGGGVFIDGLELPHWNSHEFDENVLNGYPVMYLKDQDGGDIQGPASQIFVSNCTDITIEDREFFAGSVALTVVFSSNIDVNNVTIVNQSRYGAYLYSTNNITFTQNQFQGNFQAGIYGRYIHENNLSFNEFHDNRYGIYILDSHHNYVDKNSVSDGTYGIYLRNSNDNHISKNTVWMQRIGIEISMSEDNEVSGNLASENSFYGIRLFRSDYNTLKNNTAEENTGTGLYINSGRYNVLYNNSFAKNHDHGIDLLYSNSNTFSSEMISHNGDSGVRLRYSHNNSITDNVIDSNRWYGIFATFSSNNILNHNSIKHNHFGVSFFSSDENQFKGNTINEVSPVQEQGQALLVGIEPWVSNDHLALHRLSDSVQGHITNKFQYIDVVRIQLSEQRTTSEAIETLENRPDVRFVEPDSKVELLEIPDDPDYDLLWGLEKTNSPGAWNSTTGDGDAVVAVLDTGIDYNHEDLADNMWSDQDGNHGYNAIEDDNDPMDDHGHGTHAAGTIGAVGNNSIGITGVNWNVSLMALKFISSSGTGNVSGAVACLEYVLQRKQAGDNIIATSNSWGSRSYSQTLYEAFKAHQEEGILSISAAGNYGENNDVQPLYPASFNLINTISVAASDQDDRLASFSNYGPNTVHLAAPGVGIYSTERNDNYGYRSGTSMATPHVSGLAALVWSKNQSMSMVELKNSILSHTEQIPSYQHDIISAGRMDADGSVHHDPDGFYVRTQISQGYTGSVGTDKDIFVAVTDGISPILNADVTVSFDNGEQPISLADDGHSVDQVAGDGYYSGTWTPNLSGNVTLTISVDVDGYPTYSTVKNIIIRGHTGLSLQRSFNNVLNDNNITMAQNGIRLSGSSGNLISDHVLYDLTNRAISLDDSDSNRILNNSLDGNSEGVYLSSSSSNEILENELRHNELRGIEITGDSGSNYLENNMVYNSSYGIYLQNNAHNNTVAINDLSNSSRNMCLKDSRDNHIHNNTATDGDFGIYMDKAHHNIIEHNNVSKNTLSSNSKGIYLVSSHKNTLFGNDAMENSHDAISLKHSDENRIHDNTASYSDRYGISLSDSQLNEIYDNIVRDNYRGIYLWSSSDNLIYSNLMQNNSGAQNGYGAWISSGSNDNHLHSNTVIYNDNGFGISGNSNQIENNYVSSNVRYGIYIYSQYNMISNNGIHENEHGIYLWMGSANNSIIHNHFYNNVNGLDARRDSDQNLVYGNEFTDNNISLFLSSEHIVVTSNHINGSDVGILVLDSNNRLENNTIVDSKSYGILLSDVTDTKVFLNHLSHNDVSIHITEGSMENLVIGNTIEGSHNGLLLNDSSSNLFYGNNVSHNDVGLHVVDSVEDRVHHNNILDNTKQVVIEEGSAVIWDDGDGEGNHWSDYEGEDLTGDGVGDTMLPHPEDDMDHGYYRLDLYPLVEPVKILTYEINLYHDIESGGWQFISLPIVPYESTISLLLDPINHLNAYHYTEGDWTSYSSCRAQHFNNFKRAVYGEAFFIQVTKNITLQVIGHVPVSGKTNISLHPGWNMIGHPSSEIQDAVNILPPEVTKIGVFNSSMEYNIQYIEDHSELIFEPGNGYWIYNSHDENITYQVNW